MVGGATLWAGYEALVLLPLTVEPLQISLALFTSLPLLDGCWCEGDADLRFDACPAPSAVAAVDS